MATTPHSSCSLSSVASCQLSVVGCMLAAFALYQGTTSVVPISRLLLCLRAGFSPRAICLSALLSPRRPQPLFGLHMEGALQCSRPRVLQIRDVCGDSRFAVHLDFQLTGDGTTY